MVKIAAQSDNCADIALLTSSETMSCAGPALVAIWSLMSALIVI